MLLEELELLDNITSCNVVDNYLMLDEYEQNLIKEGETPGGGGGGGGMRGRLRKWSLVRQPSVGGVQVAEITFLSYLVVFKPISYPQGWTRSFACEWSWFERCP